MKHNNEQYKQLGTAAFIGLFLVACGGGGGGGGEAAIVDGDNSAPVAAAGVDQSVSRSFTVNLDGSQSNDADGDDLTYSWVQKAGPDVTGGAGSLSGVAPAFQAPGEVATIVLDLVVNDGEEDSVADTVIVNVFEDANVTYFVDGDNGNDDTGNGSQETPYKSIAKALCEITQDQQDIYVMTRAGGAVYDETIDPCTGDPARDADQILVIPTGTSLYGGYDGNWVRNAATNATPVFTLHHGFRFAPVDFNAWFSGFNVQTDNSPGAGDSVHAVSAIGGAASLFVYDNQITAGNVGFSTAASPGTSYGLLVALMEGATIERNVINAGFGGDAQDLDVTYETPAKDGANASGATGGGGAYPGDHNGGGGGAGGTCFFCNGSKGGNGQGTRGGTGGDGGSGNKANNGFVGNKGGDGVNGDSGEGGNGAGNISAFEDGGFFASFQTGAGLEGENGESGHGGGGGGGGEASGTGLNGGPGGGGGGGGQGGSGGLFGSGGGASIGLFIGKVNNSVINDNEISSSFGGNGATGGQGQGGGASGAHNGGSVASGGNGGDGGDGGKGGTGGRGGAGGGGPSYGIAIGSNIGPTVSNNTISSGDGGNGGFGDDRGHGGDGGNSYALFDNDIADGIVPVLSNNTLGSGLAGNDGGTKTGTGGSSGDVGTSGTRNW